jgi:hypothetical protein
VGVFRPRREFSVVMLGLTECPRLSPSLPDLIVRGIHQISIKALLKSTRPVVK